MAMKSPLPDPDDLIALYASGKTLEQLAHIFHADTRTLKSVILANGGTIRRVGERIPKPLPDWLDTAVNRYQAGEGLASLAREYHVRQSKIKEWLQERDIPIRNFTEGATLAVQAKGAEWRSQRGQKGAPKREMKLPISDEELAQRYINGESEKALAEALHASRSVISRHLQIMGIERRTASEANYVMSAQMTPEQRSERAKAAHDAVRGTKRSFDELCKRALARQAKPYNVSPVEVQISQWLQELGLHPIPQLAIGPYNADLAIGPIAVEIFGGSWHAYGSHVARAGKRLNYFLDQGWSLVFIWVDTVKWPLTVDCAKYVASFYQIASIDPSIGGQYRVIRGDGQEIPAGSFYFNKVSGI